MKDVFEILAKIAREQRLELLVIGGHAMQAYGSARQTLDADVLVTDKTGAALENGFMASGYACAGRSGNAVRLRHPENEMPDLDILLVDEDTMTGMLAESRQILFGDYNLRVPGLAHLVALKLHAMKNDASRKPRDLADIIDLLRLHPAALSHSDLLRLCEKHGPEGIFEQIMENLPRHE
jgi:hypothetical protein